MHGPLDVVERVGVHQDSRRAEREGADREPVGVVAMEAARQQFTGTLSGVTAIAAGTIHALAVRSDGTAWGWGDNVRGELGNGAGVVVQRGFVPPPTYHQDRLRTVAVGYLYGVITNGLAPMPSYANQISPRDRWEIVPLTRGYVRLSDRSISCSRTRIHPMADCRTTARMTVRCPVR